VRRAAARRQVLIPSFAVGRTQELVYALLALWLTGKIPGVPIYIDSPLAVNATEVFRLHPEIFDQREQLIERAKALFDFQLVRYVRDAAESKALNTMNGPAIIIAASGMAEAGRILHHLRNGIGSHKNIVLFVGFQGEHTLGRRIRAPPVRDLRQMFPVGAEIETIGGYSAHADRNESCASGCGRSAARRSVPSWCTARTPRAGDGEDPEGGRGRRTWCCRRSGQGSISR
jgi:metallo-beta-lactamase family protein